MNLNLTLTLVQSPAERWAPGCVNATGKAKQKWQATAAKKFTKPWDRLLANACKTFCKLYRVLLHQKTRQVHRHSSLHTHFRAKFGHENEGLGTQKSLLAGGNGLTFDARYLLDF